ncbi:signal transducing adapter molecule 2 [Diorhabda carinulata]|uniref:signal transducing adapter molecule 2 n=1 Tax=Diorhabda carinulata TaxID=1163345 RepID=UPI0025A0301E|nr:signal transducing adapter molecule 2 [Diorhabda carinulata]
MGLFGSSNNAALTDEIATATSEKSEEEDWGIIMNICDNAGKSAEDAKAHLKAITNRLFHQDPHVGIKAVILLDACVKNSGKTFHMEVASRDFENDFSKLMSKGHPTVAKKLRESLKKWAENEFKSDPQLSLIPTLLNKLRKNGLDFSDSDTPVKKSTPISKDPNVVESQEEEDQILKAIELSLKESGSPRSATTTVSHTPSLYPSMNVTATPASPSATVTREPRKVRALYDFEAAEDNELTFTSGEILFVIDDSDPNWWKGSNQRGEGLFPSNFVTADLSLEPEKFLYEKAKKMVQFKDNAEIKDVKDEPEHVEINEEKIDRLLHLLHEADPTNPDKDTEEMINLEREVNAMGPLIDSELEKVDRKHAQLTQLSADLVEALSLYHTLMREPTFPPMNKIPFAFPTPSTPMTYNGTLPPNTHIPMMQPPPGMHSSDRPTFMHPGGAGMMPHHFQQMTGPQMPPSQMAVQIHQPQMMDERQQHMMQYGAPGLPNYGPGNMVSQQYPVAPPTGHTGQQNIQNGSQQPSGVQYVTSSTHMTH